MNLNKNHNKLNIKEHGDIMTKQKNMVHIMKFRLKIYNF